MYANTTGGANTAVGRDALAANTTASNNSAFGRSALVVNTSGASNVAIGTEALISNTTASNNTAVGYQAGYSNVTGTDSVSVGYQAGLFATGNYNTAVGSLAAKGGNGTFTGIENTAIGYQALTANTSASYNTAVGRNALVSATTGGYNTCIGHNSGYNISTGTKNSILGRYDGNQSGLDIRTASNNIVLSDGDGNPQIHTNSSSWTNLTWGTIDISQNSGSSANVNVVAITSGTATPLFGGGNAFSGVIIINDINNTGTAALIISAGNSINIISQTPSTTFVVSSSPTSGQIGIYLSGSVIVLKPGVTGTTYFRIITFRTRTTQ